MNDVWLSFNKEDECYPEVWRVVMVSLKMATAGEPPGKAVSERGNRAHPASKTVSWGLVNNGVRCVDKPRTALYPTIGSCIWGVERLSWTSGHIPWGDRGGKHIQLGKELDWNGLVLEKSIRIVVESRSLIKWNMLCVAVLLFIRSVLVCGFSLGKRRPIPKSVRVDVCASIQDQRWNVVQRWRAYQQ